MEYFQDKGNSLFHCVKEVTISSGEQGFGPGLRFPCRQAWGGRASLLCCGTGELSRLVSLSVPKSVPNFVEGPLAWLKVKKGSLQFMAFIGVRLLAMQA